MMKFVLFFLGLHSISILHAAASSEVVIPMQDLGLHRSGGASTPSTPVHGSRLQKLTSFCLDLSRVGIITPNHYDEAQQYIERQLNQLSLGTPHTARTLEKIRTQVQEEVERQKTVLSQSSGSPRTTLVTSSSSEHGLSDDDTSSAMVSSDSESEERMLRKMVVAIEIANALLTQTAVRTQDGLERAMYEADVNKKWAYIGAGLGLLGIVLSIVFAAVSFIPT